jgi:signal transduction histidine kinase
MSSLRQQLRRALLGSLALLLGATLFGITFVVWEELVDSFDVSLEAKAASVSALVEQKKGRIQTDFSAEFLHGFGGEKPRNYFEIWNSEGALIERSPSLGDANLPVRVGEKARRAIFWNLTFPNGRPGRAMGYMFVPQALNGSSAREGSLVAKLVVAADRNDLNETLGGLVAAVGGCGLLLFAAVWLVVPHVLRKGLAPLDRLSLEVAQIEANSLQARLSVETLPAELRPVGDRLNDLLARLARSFERERRFSADLAHELRTPIAELRTQSECALKWPEKRDTSIDHDSLAIATQLESLVNQMLALSRGEEGNFAVQMSDVGVAQLVEQVWQSQSGRAAARRIEAKFDIQPGMVKADPVLLRSIVHNLLENATDYGPSDGELRVTGAAVADGYRLCVANRADEITSADVEKLFDRFWRKDTSRSDSRHAGLGLNLSRAFATAMGWQIDAIKNSDGWLVFTLEIPPSMAKKSGG